MSDQAKPALEHEREVYGCRLAHSHSNDYAVLTTPDGERHEFSEDRGMIAQGAPSATLLALHAAKADEAARRESKAVAQQAERAAKRKPKSDEAAPADAPATEGN